MQLILWNLDIYPRHHRPGAQETARTQEGAGPRRTELPWLRYLGNPYGTWMISEKVLRDGNLANNKMHNDLLG